MYGRPKSDPNIVHHYAIRDGYKPPRPAAERKTNKGGKIHQSVDMPPKLYDQIRVMAINEHKTMNRLMLDLIEAGIALSEDGE